jgi:ABC-2 type transport system permease protein
VAITAPAVERTSEAPHLRVGERLRVLVAHREILVNLIRKELKVKYAASVLGAIWSLLNPLVFLAVFSFVVAVLGGQIPNYPVYLLSGLLAWNLYSAALQGCARSVIDNSNLVKKVAFPHEVLPLAAIGVALVDYVLQVAVLLVFMLVSGFGFTWPELALFPLAFVALLAFTTALGIWLAALNVRYRDVGHLLNIGLVVWFWATPIVYAGAQVQDLAASGSRDVLGIPVFALYLLNPLASIVGGFQRALYVQPAPPAAPVLFDVSLGWLAAVLAAVLVASLVALRLAWGYFFSRSGDFAEEL